MDALEKFVRFVVGGSNISENPKLVEEVSALRKEYDSLVKRDRLLQAYEMAGVDNWEGGEMVWDIFIENWPEYKED